MTIGALWRGEKVVFLDKYDYIHIGETKDMVGWRCVKRN